MFVHHSAVKELQLEGESLIEPQRLLAAVTDVSVVVVVQTFQELRQRLSHGDIRAASKRLGLPLYLGEIEGP